MPEHIKRLVRAYRNMPDEYGTSVGSHPEEFGTLSYLERLGTSFRRPALLWEWCAGSGRLSATAAKDASSRAASNGGVVHHPVDHRWGHDLGHVTPQVSLLWTLVFGGTSCLVVAPTCTPWSVNSRSWPTPERIHRRAQEWIVLRFVALACLVQCLLCRGFLVENPTVLAWGHSK